METKGLDYPILYSFRRCPYAMRARLSLLVSNQRVEIREVYLREKPQEFLKSSKSATVPCLVTNHETIDESLDIMIWALKLNDPLQWLKMPKLGYDFISQNDGFFKLALDKTKYHSRYPNENPIKNREIASKFISELEKEMVGSFLFGNQPSLADMAILPFLRQFAFIDKEWFDQQSWPKVAAWLSNFLSSELFLNIQKKYDRWLPESKTIFFP